MNSVQLVLRSTLQVWRAWEEKDASGTQIAMEFGEVKRQFCKRYSLQNSKGADVAQTHFTKSNDRA